MDEKSKKNDISDEQIAAQVQGGDLNAFGELMSRYEPKLLRYSKRFSLEVDEAADVIQTVFIKTYKNIKSFQTSRKFSSWIYRIAHNEIINHVKKKGYNDVSLFDGDAIWPHPVAKQEANDSIEQHDMKKMVERGLDTLSVKYREPISLYYLEEMSYKEIADVMRLPISTIGVRIKRGKDALKKAFKELGYQYE